MSGIPVQDDTTNDLDPDTARNSQDVSDNPNGRAGTGQIYTEISDTTFSNNLATVSMEKADQAEGVCIRGDMKLSDKSTGNNFLNQKDHLTDHLDPCSVRFSFLNERPFLTGESVESLPEPLEVSPNNSSTQWDHYSFADLNAQVASQDAAILQYYHTYRTREETSCEIDSDGSESDDSDISDSESNSELGLEDPEDEMFVKMLVRYYDYIDLKDMNLDYSDTDSGITEVTPMSSRAASPEPLMEINADVINENCKHQSVMEKQGQAAETSDINLETPDAIENLKICMELSTKQENRTCPMLHMLDSQSNNESGFENAQIPINVSEMCSFDVSDVNSGLDSMNSTSNTDIAGINQMGCRIEFQSLFSANKRSAKYQPCISESKKRRTEDCSRNGVLVQETLSEASCMLSYTNVTKTAYISQSQQGVSCHKQ